MQINFNPQRPFICIEGVNYILHYKEVQLAMYLWDRKNTWANQEQICALLDTSARSLRFYAEELRTVFDNFGYSILTKRLPGEIGIFKVEQ